MIWIHSPTAEGVSKSYGWYAAQLLVKVREAYRMCIWKVLVTVPLPTAPLITWKQFYYDHVG